MPMDATDSKLLKGLIAFAVLGLLVYYYPFEWPLPSYQAQAERLDQVEAELVPTRDKYPEYFPKPPDSVWDADAGRASPELPVVLPTIAERQLDYERSIAALKGKIADAQKSSRMTFAPWTDIPSNVRDQDSGLYFADKWTKLKVELDNETRRAGVELLDPNIGFAEYAGKGWLNKPKEFFEEMLRELHVAETIIRLCIKAKVEQEKEERTKGRRPEAFMRIIAVAPEQSGKTGPYIRIEKRFPEYDPKIKDPRDERSQKYKVVELRKFIQAYPVLIRLQCDLHSFRRFLASVRTPGQFLVIVNLQIVSPYLKESQRDTEDFVKMVGGEDPMKMRDYKDEHIWVEMSAAGMDFFEPVQETPGKAGDPQSDVPEMFRKPPPGTKVEPKGF